MKLLYLQGIDYLEKHLPGFSKERSDTKRAIVRLVFHQHMHHYSDKGDRYICISTSFMEQYLGCTTRTFNRINATYGLFTVEEQWHTGSARKMQYATKTLSLIVGFYTSDAAKKLMQSKRRSGKIVDSLVRPRPKNIIKVGKLMIYNVIPVDMAALKHYIDHADGRKLVFACQIYGFSNTEQFGWGMYPQEFHRSDNGRVTGVTNSLQNVDRDIREAALNGYYDYDVSNCHFAILEQVGDYPTIRDYVENTKQRRNQIAKGIGADYEDVKRCLLAMLYGANRGKNEYKCAIAGYLGRDKVDTFWDHPYIVDLYAECKAAARKLLGVDKIDFKQLSYELTTIESKILEDVTEGTIIHVPYFDGWVSDLPYDCRELERLIEERHGIRTTIKCRKIDYWAQFE